MPRILGVDIPNDKRTVIALRYIYGIGPFLAQQLCDRTGISPDKRSRELTEDELDPGEYRLEFATQPYFARSGLSAFYPEVTVVFSLEDAAGHVHVPLLLSPFGYTTYKGV